MSVQSPPKSVSSVWITLVGACCLMGMVWWLQQAGVSISPEGKRILSETQRLEAILLLLAAICLPVLVLELIFLKTWRRASTGLDWDRPADWSLKRTVLKTLGLALTLGIILTLYGVLKEYDSKTYQYFFKFLYAYCWYPLAFAVPYIAFVDSRMKSPQDIYWQLGMLVIGRPEHLDKKALKQHALGWLVKAFFLPLMVSFAANSSLFQLTDGYFDWNKASLFKQYNWVYEVLFFTDIMFAAVGYMMTFRLFDTHIRSTEPTCLGWLVALLCYPPFYSSFDNEYFLYRMKGFGWDNWLSAWHLPYAFWACLILFSLGIYAWASVIFGLRFSNLTNRGIITNGPYAICKHPAYVGKNISWWLLGVPFVPHLGVVMSLKLCLGLLFLNFVYFLRARTEERHLSADPDYVQYALYMNTHSVFSPLGKIFPWLQYKPPHAANTQ